MLHEPWIPPAKTQLSCSYLVLGVISGPCPSHVIVLEMSFLRWLPYLLQGMYDISQQ